MLYYSSPNIWNAEGEYRGREIDSPSVNSVTGRIPLQAADQAMDNIRKARDSEYFTIQLQYESAWPKSTPNATLRVHILRGFRLIKCTCCAWMQLACRAIYPASHSDHSATQCSTAKSTVNDFILTFSRLEYIDDDGDIACLLLPLLQRYAIFYFGCHHCL